MQDRLNANPNIPDNTGRIVVNNNLKSNLATQTRSNLTARSNLQSGFNLPSQSISNLSTRSNLQSGINVPAQSNLATKTNLNTSSFNASAFSKNNLTKNNLATKSNDLFSNLGNSANQNLDTLNKNITNTIQDLSDLAKTKFNELIGKANPQQLADLNANKNKAIQYVKN